MKHLELVTPNHPSYGDVCAAAQQIYHERLSVTIAHFPERLFTVFEGSHPIAAMGLHTSLTADMFRNDVRVLRAVAEYPHGTQIAEQGIFFTHGCSRAVPLLIATVAEYAWYAGFSHIAYAAIPVSARVIERLGYRVQHIGRVDLESFPAEERHNYVRWHSEHDPELCILNAEDAPSIAQRSTLVTTHSVPYVGTLSEFITDMRAQSALPIAA